MRAILARYATVIFLSGVVLFVLTLLNKDFAVVSLACNALAAVAIACAEEEGVKGFPVKLNWEFSSDAGIKYPVIMFVSTVIWVCCL